MLPLPLNFSNVWKKYRWSLNLIFFENDKSYRLEILIVYAQNKFVYAHSFNFFLTGIKFLKFFFFINLCVPNFTWNFSFQERATKKRNERYAWKFNRLYPGYTYSYIWYQICVKLFNFLEFFFFVIKVRYIPILSKYSLFSVPTWLRNNLATPTVHKPIWVLLCSKLSWCPWSCTHMPQNVCAKKVMRPTKACATTTREVSQFSHTLRILSPVQSNGGKIQVQKFVLLTSELKSTHNFSLENMFCSYFWDTSYFHTFGSQIWVRSQTLSIRVHIHFREVKEYITWNCNWNNLSTSIATIVFDDYYCFFFFFFLLLLLFCKPWEVGHINKEGPVTIMPVV